MSSNPLASLYWSKANKWVKFKALQYERLNELLQEGEISDEEGTDIEDTDSEG